MLRAGTLIAGKSHTFPLAAHRLKRDLQRNCALPHWSTSAWKMFLFNVHRFFGHFVCALSKDRLPTASQQQGRFVIVIALRLLKNPMRLHGLILLLLLAAPVAAQESITVGVPGNVVLIPVKLNERYFNFSLATGSEASTIDLSTGTGLGLIPHGRERILENFRNRSGRYRNFPLRIARPRFIYL